MKKIIVATLFFLSLISCAPRQLQITNPQDALSPLPWWRAAAPGDDMAFKDVAAAVRRSLEYFKKLPADTFVYFGHEGVTAFDMAVTLQNFLLITENDSLSYDQKVEQIKKNFVPYQSVGSDGRGKMLITGYYGPVISCRLKADDSFR